MEKELGSKLTYFKTLQLLVEQQEELSVQKSHLHAAEAAVAAIRETRGQAVAEYRRTLSDLLAKAEQKTNGLTQDLIKAERKTKLQLLTAPVDGVVQQLAIHSIGGVVTSAQALLVVVPSDSRLEIEAMVSNRDIGLSSPHKKPRSRSIPSNSPAMASARPGAQRLAALRHPRPTTPTTARWGRRTTPVSRRAQKAYEMAMDGNVAMIKFLLSRMIPKERPVGIELPFLDCASEGVDALAAIVAAVSSGQISPQEAANLAQLVAKPQMWKWRSKL